MNNKVRYYDSRQHETKAILTKKNFGWKRRPVVLEVGQELVEEDFDFDMQDLGNRAYMEKCEKEYQASL